MTDVLPTTPLSNGGPGEVVAAPLFDPPPTTMYEWKLLAQRLEGKRLVQENEIRRLRRAEKNLADRLSEATVQFDEAPCGMLSMRASGLILRANRAFADLVQVAPDKLVGRSLNSFIDDDCAAFDRYRARVFSHDQPRSTELRLRASDGAGLWVRLVSVDRPRNKSSLIPEWQAAVLDVTPEKTLDDEVHREREYLRAVFDCAPLLIATVDVSGSLQLANRQWERLLGWTMAELRRERIWRMLFPHHTARQAARQFIQEASGDWRVFRTHTRYGGVVDLRCAASQFSGDWRLIAAQNVSDQVRAEETLRERQESLRRTAGLNTISEMAAAIAHEVNQPLTALINYATGAAYHLRSLPGTPRDALEAVDKSVVEAHRAADIIRHVRALVSRRRIEQIALDINALVTKLADVLAVEAARARVNLQTVCERNLPLVHADRVQVEQIIINLVHNAFDAMEHTPRAQREVMLCTRRDRQNVIVSVVDRGQGIPPEVAPKLFSPFFTTKPFGTGIGLSLCLSIVEAHGGRLWTDPNPDGGSIFRFTLPLAPVSRTSIPRQTPSAAPSTSLADLAPPSTSDARAPDDEERADLVGSPR